MGDEDSDQGAVEVLQIPDEVDDDWLWLYFEGRRSGGGAIRSLERNGDRALIVFERAQDAVNVLSKPSHVLSETTLLVRKKPQKDRKKFLLRGLSSSTNLEVLELFVENLTGVDQETFNLYKPPGKDLALVDLQEPPAEGLQKVREKLSKKTLEGARLSLEEVEYTDAVLVKNLPPAVSEDLLTLYFESPRTGGGEVTEVSRVAPGITKVSFKDPESVNAVLRKPHVLEEAVLTVTPYYPFLSEEENAPAAEADAPEHMLVDEDEAAALTSPAEENLSQKDRKKFLLRGLSSSTSLEVLELFVENLTGVDQETFNLYKPPGKDLALVDLQEPPAEGLQKVREKLSKKTLEGARLSLEEVEYTDAVLVKNLPPAVSEDLLTLYFESPRTGGGEVTEVSRVAPGIAKVSFKDPESVSAVLRKPHILEDSALTVTPYYAFLSAEEHTPATAAADAPADAPERMLVHEDRADPVPPDAPVLDDSGVTAMETGVAPGGSGGGAEQTERILRMKPAMLAYLQLHHQQLLAEMGAVALFPLDTGDGLSIRGEAEACHSVCELLAGVVAGTLTRTIMVRQPGVARFLRQDEGAAILAEMTAKFQVYISLEKVHWEPLEEQDVFELAWRMMSAQDFRRHAGAESDGGSKGDAHAAGADPGASARLEEARRIWAEIGSSSLSEAGGSGQDLDLYGADPEGDGEKSSALDEDDAGLSLAIQLSMETGQDQDPDPYSQDLQKVLELSKAEAVAASLRDPDPYSQDLQKVLELSKAEAGPARDPVPLSRDLQQVLERCRAGSAHVAEIEVLAAYPHDLVRVDIALGKKVGQRQREERLEHACFRRLSSLHRRCAELIALKHAVHVTIRGTGAVVSGFTRHVDHALPELHELTRRAAGAGSDQDVLRTVRWLRHAGGGAGGEGAEPYSPEVTVFLESAWRDKRRRVDVVLDGRPHIIDLERMLEVSVTTGTSERISRRMLSSADLYREEDYSLISDVPDTARLEENSAEYQEVVQEFRKSIRDAKFRVVQVEKLMNRLLYEQYQLKKADLEQKAGARRVERTLYHGTAEGSVKEICVHGFNRSFCGRNATVYGQGVYFAVSASLSLADTYSPPNADGHKFILVARVLTGEFTVGTGAMRAAPLKTGSGTTDRYHSVVDRLDEPSMFVIFNDTQAYPQYLLTCQRL